MNITEKMTALLTEKGESYPRNDIGTARLFYDVGKLQYQAQHF